MCSSVQIVPYSVNSIIMNHPIVHFSAGVTLIAGGPVHGADLRAALGWAPHLVAADGGADRALALGAVPTAVIGDMDSISAASRARLGDVLLEVPEQDSTDFDKAMRSVAAPFVLALGCLGGRVDHELAVLSALVRSPRPPCLLIGRQDVVFAAPPQIRLDLVPGDRFSLFPMQPVTGQSEGLRWPIGGIGFAPNGRGGTSNEVTGPVHLRFDGPGMLIIVPRSRLGAALSALVPAA